MNQDHVFRYLLIVVLLMLVSIGLVHRVRARTGESLDRKQEGIVFLIALRLSGLATFAGIVAYCINPTGLAFSGIPLPAWARWMGVLLGCVTGFLLFWTLQSLGKNLTDTVVTRKAHSLVTTGPYRWVRHPFYDCAALMILAVSLITANGLFLVTGGVAVCLFSLRSRIEERNLLSRFGEDYRIYSQRTGRFLPRMRKVPLS